MDDWKVTLNNSVEGFGSRLAQFPTLTKCSRQSPVAMNKNRLMSTSDAGGYAEPSRGSDLIDLFVQCLNGEGCMLTLSASCTGWEVYRMVSKQLPQKKGAQLTLHHLDLPLILHKELQAQGIMGKAATLSCTIVPTDLYAAWCTVQGLPVSQGELALAGVTRIEGSNLTKYLHHLPESLEHLTFGSEFNHSLEGVTLPSSLQSLTFGIAFNQSLEGVTLPSSLQSLTFGRAFNQSLEGVTLPSSLQSLIFGRALLNQSSGWKELTKCQAVFRPWNLEMWLLNQRLVKDLTLPNVKVFRLWNLAMHSLTRALVKEWEEPSSLKTLAFGKETL